MSETLIALMILTAADVSYHRGQVEPNMTALNISMRSLKTGTLGLGDDSHMLLGQ